MASRCTLVCNIHTHFKISGNYPKSSNLHQIEKEIRTQTIIYLTHSENKITYNNNKLWSGTQLLQATL